eukprot:TRINITY_DN1366_c0_g2_i1.p1 TRINITY_DN1366_c0_g2~~TRINITY_DN1366_c0_g2_i1.p1  ORF type:complete len:521 (+),score=112.10 TRINITY_DN1366_c0_g2_i1:693-2255(+)
MEMERTRLTALTKENNPHIIQLYHSFRDRNSSYLLTGYTEGTELWSKIVWSPHEPVKGEDRIRKLVGLPRTAAVHYLSQILAALCFLHEHGLVHRDVKPENCIVSDAGRLRLIDFGTLKDTIHTELNGGDFVGTPEYISPEAVENGKGCYGEVTTSTDMWAFGCVVYQLLMGGTPFKGRSDFLTMQRVTRHSEQLILDTCSTAHLLPPELHAIRSLCVLDPAQRATSSEIKQWDLFRGVDWERIHEQPEPEPSGTERCVVEHSQGLMDGNEFEEEDPHVRALVAHHLRVRSLLNRPPILKEMFGEDRFTRTRGREVPGLSMAEESGVIVQERNRYHFLHASDPCIGHEAGAEVLQALVDKVNHIIPAPLFVVVSGKLTLAEPCEPGYEDQVRELKSILGQLRPHVRVMLVPTVRATQECLETHVSHFGDDYYSFWAGPCLFVAVNSELCLQEGSDEEFVLSAQAAQNTWLQQQLFMAKSAARHTFVLSATPCLLYTSDAADEEDSGDLGGRRIIKKKKSR